MRCCSVGLLCLISLVTFTSSSGQITNLQQLVLQANQAFARGSSVSSVVLSGQVESYAGSSGQNGTITLTTHADGSSSVQIELGSGVSGQTQDTFANGQPCAWSGSDGVSHPVAGHNCLVPLAWFLPEVAFFSSQLPANGTLSAPAAQNGPTIHWAIAPLATASAQLSALMPHIGSYDLEFDASTLLPTSFSYLTHPDSNAGCDIPVLVQYSDYRTVNGVNIPFHIQRYFNGVLSLDITISNAVVTE